MGLQRRADVRAPSAQPVTVARFGLGLALAAVCLLPLAGGRAGGPAAASSPPGAALPARLAGVRAGADRRDPACSQLLGLVGLLKPLPVALGCLAAGAAMWRRGRARGRARRAAAARRPPRRRAPDRLRRWRPSAVRWSRRWATRLLPAIDQGMTGADTVWYHLPQAAALRAGRLDHARAVLRDGRGHGVLSGHLGALPRARDALVRQRLPLAVPEPRAGSAWLLLAACCLGRPYGLGPAQRARRDARAGHPDHGGDPARGRLQRRRGAGAAPGRRRAPRERRPHGRGGHAGGPGRRPALGTKLSMAVAARRARGGRGGRWRPGGERLRMALACGRGRCSRSGGVWYVRNLVAFGNPIPPRGLDLGPLSLPSPPLTKLTLRAGALLRPGRGLAETLPAGPARRVRARPGGRCWPGASGHGRGGRRRPRARGADARVWPHRERGGVVFTPQGLGTEADPLLLQVQPSLSHAGARARAGAPAAGSAAERGQSPGAAAGRLLAPCSP